MGIKKAWESVLLLVSRFKAFTLPKQEDEQRRKPTPNAAYTKAHSTASRHLQLLCFSYFWNL